MQLYTTLIFTSLIIVSSLQATRKSATQTKKMNPAIVSALTGLSERLVKEYITLAEKLGYKL